MELAKLPTGRTLILVSDGFEVDSKRAFYAAVFAYLPNRPQFKLEKTTGGLRDALQVAWDRNVVIFTIDSRGAGQASLESGGAMDAAHPLGAAEIWPALAHGAAGRLRRRSNTPGTTAICRCRQPAMEELARSTGRGVYSHDNGALLKQLRGALNEQRDIICSPMCQENSAHDGKFRAITVESGDKKLSLGAKAGYWAVTAR